MKGMVHSDRADVRRLLNTPKEENDEQSWHLVPRSHIHAECVENNCPHIDEDNRCPFWGPYNKKETSIPVVRDLWLKRDGCPFLRWAKEDVA